LDAFGDIIFPAYASPVSDTGQTKCYDDSKEIPCPSAGQPFYGQNDANNNYTWYDPDPAANGGDAGTEGNDTDTKDFMDALNNAKFGGFEDLRLPTIKELSFLVDYSIREPRPTIDTAYFPNTMNLSYFWSSSTNAENPLLARQLDFREIFYGINNKSGTGFVRAVRGGQSGSFGYLTLRKRQ
jgi:hypothetical protein